MGRGSSGAKKAAGGGLGTKITVFVGTILVLVTLLTGFSLYAVLLLAQPTTRPPQPASPAASRDQTPAQLAAPLNEARTLEQRFSQQQDPASMVQFEETVNNLLARAEELEKNSQQRNDQKIASSAGLIKETVSRYGTAFKDLVQAYAVRGLDEGSGLRQKLAQAGDGLGQPPAPASDTQGLAEALIQVGRAEQNYFAARTIDNQRLLGQATVTLAETAARSSLPDSEKQALSKNIKAYTIAFDRYLAVTLATDDPNLGNVFAAEQVKQEETMHKAALEIEKLISGLTVAQADATVQSLRQLEREYLKQATADNEAKVSAALADLGRSLDSSPVTSGENAPIKQAVAEYQAAFADLVKLDKEIMALKAALDNSFASLQTLIGDITPAAPPPPAAKLPLPYLSPQTILMIIGGLWLTVFLCTLLLAINLTRAIRSPLLRMTGLVQQMASEDGFSQDFPPEKHEFGALAAALNVLRQRNAPGSGSAPMPPLEKIDTLALRIKDRIAHDALIAGVFAGQEEALAGVRVAAARILTDAAGLRQQLGELTRCGQEVQEAGGGCEQSVAAALDSARSTVHSADQLATVIGGFTDMAEEISVVALNSAIKSTRTTTQGHEFSTVTEELDRLARRSAETAREINQLLSSMASDVTAGERLGETSRHALQHLTTSAIAAQSALQAIEQTAEALQVSAGDAEALLAELGESCGQAGRLFHNQEALNQEIAEALTLLGASPAPAPEGLPSRDEAARMNDESREIGAALDLSLDAADQDERS